MRSGFFNSEIIGYDAENMPVFDRAEEASFFAKFFNQFISNGVFPNPSTNMQVLATEGMQVKVDIGTCFINGYMGWVESVEFFEIEESDTQPRIDRLVARLDFTNRSIELFIKKGTPIGNPVAPILQRDYDIYEIGLADIKVNTNIVEITQENITDLRLNTELCGIVANQLQHVDTTTLFNQYQDWLKRVISEEGNVVKAFEDAFTNRFNNWFETLQYILDGDVAGHLQIEIEDLQNKTDGIGLGRDTVTIINEKDINNIDLNGFAYIQNCNCNGIKIEDGYIWQLIYTDDYKVQFYTQTKENSVLQTRMLINGKWSKWITMMSEIDGVVNRQLATKTIEPSTNNTYDLGTTGNMWRDIYTHRIITPDFKLFSSSLLAVMGVGVEFTVRHQDDVNRFMPISASAFNVNSSERYKENIRDMTEEEANKIDELVAKIFDYKVKENGTNIAGLIAEDVYKIFPNVVTLKQVDGKMVPDSIDYSKLITPLLKKVQILEKRLSRLENKL